MLRSLITCLLFPTSLFAQEDPFSSPKTTTTPLVVHEYADFLKALAVTTDSHRLYDPTMSDQINESSSDRLDYITVENQWEEPMHHLTTEDVMRYCNWKDHPLAFHA